MRINTSKSKENGHKLKYLKFHFKKRNCFIVKMVKYKHSLPRGVAESPSLEMSNPYSSSEQRVGLDHLSHSVNL